MVRRILSPFVFLPFLSLSQSVKLEGNWDYSITYDCPWGHQDEGFSLHLQGGRSSLTGSVYGGQVEIETGISNEFPFSITGQENCWRKGTLKYSVFAGVEYLEGDWQQEGIYNAQWGSGLCCNGRLRLQRRALNNTPETKRQEFSFKEIKKGDTLTFQHVVFELSKATFLIPQEATKELDSLVAYLTREQAVSIQLNGHTDIYGSPKLNLKLSKQRVVFIKGYLTDHGIKTKRIKTQGYGSSRPLIKKGTDKEREVNRRVEVIILRD